MSETSKLDYNPSGWYWDPNDHIPVYVLEYFAVYDNEVQKEQTSYAKVLYPVLSLGDAGAMRNLDMRWMAATNLVKIRQQCEQLY